tara:strand:- start:197 stop:577 length:381 start_codon:yes stop_codon:yes gene_type:complete
MNRNKRKSNVDGMYEEDSVKSITCKRCDNPYGSLFHEPENEEIVNVFNKTKRVKGGTLYYVKDFELAEKNHTRDNRFGLLTRYYNERYENNIEELTNDKKVVSPDSRLSRGMTIRQCMNFMDNLTI